MNKDCIVYDIKKDTEVHWLDGYLIKVPKSKDFNYEYILFIPKNINENTTLIIEGSNCTISVSDLESAKDIILKEGLYPSLPIYDVANELGLPVLFPLFPRIYNGEETIYNHMLSSNSLDNSTLKIKELGLERVDLQLINMFKDAKKRLMEENINIEDKFIIDGFSASAKFANRFTLLHPEYVELCVAGGVSGVLTLPLKELNGEKLLYPIGLGDFDTNIEMFKNVRQFYYMGNLDNKNDPFLFNEDGIVKNSGIIKADELKQIINIFGIDSIKDRWPKTQRIYKDLGINAVFETYNGFGHDPRCAKKDIKNEIEKILELQNRYTKNH